MVTKTRERLIEVARQLFARKGMENTTMNDIALASDKGRRTIYTYFKNKREIYNAVVESESEHLVARLREVVGSDKSPVEKLRRYLEVRFDIVADAVQRREGPLRNLFGRDYRRIDKIRRLAIAKETELFNTLMRQGVDSGDFNPAMAREAHIIDTIMFQGVDYSHLRDNFSELGFDSETMRRRIIDFMMGALTLNPSDNQTFTDIKQ